MADTYKFWRDSLAWRANPKLAQPDFDKARPETGFYRGQRGEAVAIWWVGDQCLAQVHKPARTNGITVVSNYDRADIIGDNVFSYCCRHPISHEAYQAFVKSGVWPEDVEPTKHEPTGSRVGQFQGRSREGSREYYAEDRADREQAAAIDNTIRESEGESGTVRDDQKEAAPTTPEATFSSDVSNLIRDAKKFLTSIDNKITEKVHADRVANYAVAASALATRAENARKTEKQPHWDAGVAVDAKWRPIISYAEETARNLKATLIPYLNEQKRKAAAEAAEAQRLREEATLAGETPPLAGARPSPTTAGTQGRVSLKGQKAYRISDLRAAAEFIAMMNAPPQEFIEGVLSSAQKLIKAGVEVPGIEVSREDVVA